MHGKKNKTSEEDPVYTVMATLAKHLIEQHTHEQHQQILNDPYTFSYSNYIEIKMKIGENKQY